MGRTTLPNPKTHGYEIQVKWTGNLGPGTSGYREYSRDHEIAAPGKPAILGSSDPSFQGSPNRYNPEEMLVASLSTCHMLWYLHLCADAGIVVVEYSDSARGTMQESALGGGRFTEVVLEPNVTVGESADMKLAETLHERAREKCYIANSVAFPVLCRPKLETAHGTERASSVV